MRIFALAFSKFHAANAPQTGAASLKVIFGSFIDKKPSSGIHIYSALQPNPTPVDPKTSSPFLNSFTFFPTASISPANSVPSIGFLGFVKPTKIRPKYGLPFRYIGSSMPTTTANIFISTSLSLGVGFSTSLN